jgi:hypothetical protein
MSKAVRITVALGAAAGALVLATWFDRTVMEDAQRQAAATFDMAGAMWLWTLGLFMVAGAVLLLGVLAWRARSAVVGILYLLVGGFFAALPWLWTLTASTNDAPPALPEPFAGFVGNAFVTTTGPLNAVGTIGAGMAIAGIAALAGSWRERSAAEPAAANAEATPQPLTS